VDASIDCPANGPITVSGDWVAAGPWTRTWTVVTATGGTAGSPGTLAAAGARMRGRPWQPGRALRPVPPRRGRPGSTSRWRMRPRRIGAARPGSLGLREYTQPERHARGHYLGVSS